jgi:hypothetical protein
MLRNKGPRTVSSSEIVYGCLWLKIVLVNFGGTRSRSRVRFRVKAVSLLRSGGDWFNVGGESGRLSQLG